MLRYQTNELLEFVTFMLFMSPGVSSRDSRMKSKIDAIGGRIDLNLLVVFDAIYRLRNLTAAGRTLGLSQPAMSHALSRLRATFKDPLFVRLPRGLQPTPLANDLAPALMEGLGAIRGGLERRTFDPANSTRIFNVGMGEISEGVQLPRLLRELRASAPTSGCIPCGFPALAA